MPTRQEALKRFKIEVTSEQDIASAILKSNHRTYKGHGDDYAVVEQGLMARGAGSGVVMQGPVRARRRTLVLHTPPSSLPPAPATEGDASPAGVSLTTAANNVGCRVFRRSQTEPACSPFRSRIREAGAVLHQLPCDGRRSGGAFEDRSIKY